MLANVVVIAAMSVGSSFDCNNAATSLERPTCSAAGVIRIAELKNVVAAGSREPDPTYPNTSTADLEICRAVAETVERNSLVPPESSPFLQETSWQIGGVDVGLETIDEGTMHGSSAVVVAEGVATRLYGWFQKPDESNPWILTTRWFFHQGRPLIVRFPGWSDTYPKYVGALGDDLSERPLCRFEVKVDVRLVPERSDDEKICQTIWDGDGETIKPTTSGTMPEVEGRDLIGGRTVIDGAVVVDAMNDGNPIRMYHYRGESGAGRGCELSYYDTAPDDISSAAHKAWNAAQGLNIDDVYARRTCSDDEPVWNRVDGRTYLLSWATGARDPKFDRHEFRNASSKLMPRSCQV